MNLISPKPVYACEDGIDNDSDGLVDFPDDPGCTSETDDDEFNQPAVGGTVADVFVNNEWETGYCAEVTVSNNGPPQLMTG